MLEAQAPLTNLVELFWLDMIHALHG